jgi:DNA-binding NarL/FixJ family response regulator
VVPRAGLTAVAFDRYRLWLDTLTHVARAAGVELVGRSTAVRETVALLERERPNVFILGLERGGESDGTAATLLQAAGRIGGISTIVVSSEDDPELIAHCLAGGAGAYVLKTIRPDDLSSTIRQAVDRCVYLFGAPKASLERKREDARLWTLTARELEVLTLVADGLTSSDVARRLWVSLPTVKFHLSRIYEKLGVTNRTAAVRWAQSHGLLEAEIPSGRARLGQVPPQSLSRG